MDDNSFLTDGDSEQFVQDMMMVCPQVFYKKIPNKDVLQEFFYNAG